ncbi:MAG: response regulator [Candidatus Krumholzibacteriota bacterium]|nr:response regulator [Candidatus Krumholzibacteriota bacterium]
MDDLLSLNEMGSIDILVAEDDKDLRRLIQFDLEASNFKVRMAENGKIAMEMIQDKKPDCLILDVMMPVMDGFEVCKRLKSMNSTRDIPIIFLTACGSTEDKVKGMGFDADDYITKPFNFTELSARIKLQVSKREAKKNDVKQAGQKALHQAVNDLAEKIAQPLDLIRQELVRLMKMAEGKRELERHIRRCEASRLEIRNLFVELRQEINPFYEPEDEKETVKV